MNKRVLGQYFTIEDKWLKPHIVDFILKSECDIVYDPFAGNGDIIQTITKRLRLKKCISLDIDKNLPHKINDSLINIPPKENAIIITNPPYLTNYSAKRRNIFQNVEKYFKITDYHDLYLLALENMLKAQEYVVAIIPETFINSSFKHKNRLYSITIIEEDCFGDTETPICVVCFDGKIKSFNKIKVYKNDTYLNTLDFFEKQRLKPQKNINIIFNDKNGQIALRAVDTTNPKNLIGFMHRKELDYNIDNIKNSSRSITIVKVKDLPNVKTGEFIKACNKILYNFRTKTDDVLLSPFKNNMKNGKRRRRLDYKTARAIMEKAFIQV